MKPADLIFADSRFFCDKFHEYYTLQKVSL